jgi:hypothetical protein
MTDRLILQKKVYLLYPAGIRASLQPGFLRLGFKQEKLFYKKDAGNGAGSELCGTQDP